MFTTACTGADFLTQGTKKYAIELVNKSKPHSQACTKAQRHRRPSLLTGSPNEIQIVLGALVLVPEVGHCQDHTHAQTASSIYDKVQTLWITQRGHRWVCVRVCVRVLVTLQSVTMDAPSRDGTSAVPLNQGHATAVLHMTARHATWHVQQ